MDEDFTDPSFLAATVWAIIVCLVINKGVGKMTTKKKTLSPCPRLATRLDESKSKSPHLVFIGAPPGGAHDAHPPGGGGENKNQYFGLRSLTDSVSVDVMEALFFLRLSLFTHWSSQLNWLKSELSAKTSSHTSSA